MKTTGRCQQCGHLKSIKQVERKDKKIVWACTPCRRKILETKN